MSGEVKLCVEVGTDPGVYESRYFEKLCEFPGVPRKGDLVELTSDGWNEEVYRTWFHADDSSVSVELGRINDTGGEDLAGSLLASGWVEPFSAPVSSGEGNE